MSKDDMHDDEFDMEFERFLAGEGELSRQLQSLEHDEPSAELDAAVLARAEAALAAEKTAAVAPQPAANDPVGPTPAIPPAIKPRRFAGFWYLPLGLAAGILCTVGYRSYQHQQADAPLAAVSSPRDVAQLSPPPLPLPSPTTNTPTTNTPALDVPAPEAPKLARNSAQAGKLDAEKKARQEQEFEHEERFAAKAAPSVTPTAAAPAMAASPPAMQAAKPATPPVAARAKVRQEQEVTVTGERMLRRADRETPSPVQVIESQDLKKSGYNEVRGFIDPTPKEDSGVAKAWGYDPAQNRGGPGPGAAGYGVVSPAPEPVLAYAPPPPPPAAAALAAPAPMPAPAPIVASAAVPAKAPVADARVVTPVTSAPPPKPELARVQVSNDVNAADQVAVTGTSSARRNAELAHADPIKWLALIEQKLKDGDNKAALAEWDKFLEAHPAYPVKDELSAKIKALRQGDPAKPTAPATPATPNN